MNDYILIMEEGTIKYKFERIKIDNNEYSNIGINYKISFKIKKIKNVINQ